MATPIITLLTDFGYRDHFVAVMKGVIHGINPEATVLDISHSVNSYDILSAAFVLDNFYQYYPLRTINLVIVDPGVGTERRPILACGEDHYFIAPDNGVLSYIYKSANVQRVIAIDAPHCYHEPVSKTFHGRDIFSPVTAYFSKSLDPDNFGEPVKDYVKLNIPKPKITENRMLEGAVLYVDHFGNMITNISPGIIAQVEQKTGKKLSGATIGDQTVAGLLDSYEAGIKVDYGMVLGSTGNIEIFSFQGNAALRLQKKRGDKILFEFR